MVVYSAIHARLHNAMAKLLDILHRLNGMYLNDEEEQEEIGEEIASRADFEGPLDVVPVSDPNIFSEAQRFAQVQAVEQRAQAMPQLYNLRKVEERILETLKIPNAKDLLVPPMEPKEQNAVNENVAATLGRPVLAFPEQDHIAHLKTHLAYMTNPVFGANPLIAPTYVPVMLNHIKEHIALWYASSVFDVSNEATGGDIGEDMKQMKDDPEGRKSLDRMLAEASSLVIEHGDQIFQSLPPVIQQAQAMMQQLAPPPPMDPTQAAMQAAQLQAQTQQARLQLEGQKAQQNAQLKQAEMQQDQAKMQADQAEAQQDMQLRMALEMQKQQAEDQRTAAELQARMAMNTEDNRTALELASAEIASGERIAVSNGTGINPNPGA